MEQSHYDRAADDAGNIVEFGHVNVCVADQQHATDFYVSGIGLTRDPYLMTGTWNMWVNAGRSQFHLPTGQPQRVRGTIGLVVPDVDLLLARLMDVREPLRDTAFQFFETGDGIEAICPWGNRLRLHAPDETRFGPVRLGIAYVAFDVPPGTALAIARFYREIIGAPATPAADGRTVSVLSGDRQYLTYRETDAPQVPYDRHHIQIYLADFSGPYERLRERDLISEESGPHQYRFENIVDLDTGRPLFAIDHEMRSLRHPLYGRQLVNRDPDLDLARYVPGHERLAWAAG